MGKVIDYIDKINKMNHSIMIDGVVYDDYLTHKKRRQKQQLMQWYNTDLILHQGGEVSGI